MNNASPKTTRMYTIWEIGEYAFLGVLLGILIGGSIVYSETINQPEQFAPPTNFNFEHYVYTQNQAQSNETSKSFDLINHEWWRNAELNCTEQQLENQTYYKAITCDSTLIANATGTNETVLRDMQLVLLWKRVGEKLG